MSLQARYARSVEPDLAVADMAAARLQIRSRAGPRNTLSAFRQEKCAVTGTLDQSAGAVQELIRNPFKRYGAVGAAVEVNEGSVPLAYHHQHFAVVFHAQATGVSQLIKAAQGRGQKVFSVGHGLIISASTCRRQSCRIMRRREISGRRR